MSDPKSNSSPATLFQPGWREDAHRNRRRTGSRAKLAKRFFEDTYAAWEEQGESALARAAFHDPMGFVSMVARLMPQKIEVSTPTDGMSDERLAEMLDMAERMAALRSSGAMALPAIAHKPADENGVTLDHAEEGGGGPLGLDGARGVSSPHPITADPGRIAETPHNLLDRSNDAIVEPEARSLERQIAETPSLPYPVGRPFAKPDHAIERENRNALAAVEDDIDPASLF